MILSVISLQITNPKGNEKHFVILKVIKIFSLFSDKEHPSNILGVCGSVRMQHGSERDVCYIEGLLNRESTVNKAT